HEAAGAVKHPAFPAPSHFRGRGTGKTSDTSCRGNARSCPAHHCKRSGKPKNALASSIRLNWKLHLRIAYYQSFFEGCPMIATLGVLLVGLVLSAFSFVAPGEATTDLPDMGGPGGSPYRVLCPSGTYLSGIAGRAGAFVDRLQLVCAPLLRFPFHLD